MSPNIFLEDFETPRRGESGESSPNIFLKDVEDLPERESVTKESFRATVQAPLGAAKKWTWPADVLKLAAGGFAEGGLQDISENEPQLAAGTPGRKQASEAGEKLLHKYFPTQERVEEVIEDLTGVPLRPKTEAQRLLRLAGEGFGFRGGGRQEKLIAGASAPAISELLQTSGMPAGLADFLAIGTSTGAPIPTLSKATHPSGLPKRAFELRTKPTRVSEARHQAITEKVEGDVRGLVDDILGENPNYKEITTDPNYRNNLESGFEEVSEKAKDIPSRFTPRHLLVFMKRRLRRWGEERKGLKLSESEEAFRDNYNERMRKLDEEGRGNFGVSDSVDQFRKNNSELGEYFDPSKPKAANTGKRDAILEENRAIQEFYERQFPDSEFTRLFKEQNQKWSRLMDAEAIEGHINDIFSGQKIDFKKVDKLLDSRNTNLRRPFQRFMGDKGFEQFEGLMGDLQKMKNPYGLLKKVEGAGFKRLAQLMGSYVLHPNLAKGKAVWDIGKSALKMLLDKPQLAVTWRSGIQALKQGKLQEAEDRFGELDEAREALQAQNKRIGTQAHKAGLFPEEIATSRPEGFTERAYTKGEDRKIYEFYPSEEAIKHFNLKDKLEPITKRDHDLLSGLDVPPLTQEQEVLYKNQWNQLLDPKLRKTYYEFQGSPKQEGTLGDWITDPNIRKIYKDVLKTPVIIDPKTKGARTGNIIDQSKKPDFEHAIKKARVPITDKFWENPLTTKLAYETGYYPGGSEIKIGLDFSPAQVFSNLVHEGHHAYQTLIKAEKSVAKTGMPSMYKKQTFMQEDVGYFERRREVGARMAARYASKRLSKARHASIKTAKAQQAVEKSLQAKRASP